MSFYIQCSSFKVYTQPLAYHFFWGQVENNFSAQQQLVNSFLGNFLLYTLEQKHSNTVVIIQNKIAPFYKEGDALVTNQKGIILGIKTADCIPLLLIDKKREVIGAAHIGWRGAANNILLNTIEAMESVQASRKDIGVVFGPCIHQPSYEVTPEFKTNISALSPNYEKLFFKQITGNLYFDLRSFVKEQLKMLGIERIYDCNIDTYSSNFCSHRRMLKQNKLRMHTNLALFMLAEKTLTQWYDTIQGLVPLSIRAKSKLPVLPLSDTENENLTFKSPRLPTLSTQWEKNSLFKLKSGTYPIQARLDLHGLTVNEAYNVLENFLIKSYDLGYRGVLVITGKGNKGEGIIRKNFYDWIELPTLKQYIVTYSVAASEHGGSGAFYLLLKRNRN